MIVSCFGVYEYQSFGLFGRSNGLLIKNLLPPNIGIRVGGIYGQPNLFSLLLLLGILSLFYLHIHSRHFNISSYFKYFKYIPIFITSYAFFLTRSRSGVISICSCLFSSILFIFQKKIYSVK